MANPKYVQRIARLPEVFELLSAFPEGLPVAELANRLGVRATELREDLLAFYTADVGPYFLGLSRPDVLEFVGPDGESEDPNDAEIVRIVDQRNAEELGVEYVDASELAQVYIAARMELDKTGDEDLAGAIDVLEETMFGAAAPSPGSASAGSAGDFLGRLREARMTRQRVRIDYSRAWQQGVHSHEIEPYRLVQTRRGWEVDAGPVDPNGGLRTYLLSNIRSLAVLDDEFESPAELSNLLEAQRATSQVRVTLPFASRWAAEMYAEQVVVVAEDASTVTLDLEMLPPLAQRVGLLLLVAGPDAVLDAPAELVEARATLAKRLIAHHDK